MKVKPGVFMPTARILCLECHGPNFPRKQFDPSSEEWERQITPQPMEEHHEMTFCDQCGEDIQMEESIAREHNLVKALKDRGYAAYMEQTGGMNDAGSVETTDGGYYMFTYNFNGDDGWWLIRYDEDGDPVDSVDQYSTYSDVAILEHILRQKDIKRR